LPNLSSINPFVKTTLRQPSGCTKDLQNISRFISRSARTSYVDGITLIDQINPQDNTHAEIERLIRSHRRVLIDTIVSDAKHGTAPAPDASATDAPTQDAPEPDAPAQVASAQPSSNAAQARSSLHPKELEKPAYSVSHVITTRRLRELNDIYRRTLTVATIRHLKSSQKSETFSGSSRKSRNNTSLIHYYAGIPQSET
jgi:hypothetical protein